MGREGIGWDETESGGEVGYIRGMASNEWDAASYNKNARFVSDLGSAVLELLAAQEGESILDLGCGDGALTERIPGEVWGLDAAPSMVEAARQRGLHVVEGDMHHFALGRKFDAVFTNAVLHWTRDIHAVVGCVQQHLRPGGRFVGEFGGFGNVAAIATALRASLRESAVDDEGFAWYYPTAQEFAQVLEQGGFRVNAAQLIPRPTPLPTGMRKWMETFARPWVKHLPREEQERVFDRAVELLAPALRDTASQWTADYVRLRFHATLLTEAGQPA
ncbi:MAG: class I SAM-dependent methyltransferase [Bryobacter sp.]